MNLRLVTPATVEPVTLAQANFHLRLTTDATDVTAQPEDTLVAALITAARQSAEEYLNRAIAEATYEYRGASFDMAIPMAPVQSIVSLKYVDTAGALQTVLAPAYELAGTPAEPLIRAAYGTSWPSDVRGQDDSIRLQFVAGYSAGNPLPKPIYQAVLLMVGHLFENREDSTALQLRELPMGAKFLLNPYRIGMGV